MSISQPVSATRKGRQAGSPAWLSLLACLFLAVNSRAASLPSGFIEEEIGGTWNEAVGLAFAPDGRMFVWERGGTVWTVENGVKSAAPFLDITEEVAVWNNYGLLGFCLHPDFYNNGYVYLLYVADRHHVRFFGTGSYDAEETETHVATVGRITRYTARAGDGFRSVDPASRLVLVGQTLTNGFPLVSGQHGVGTIMFGADGTLLASCGDGASSSITDIGSGSGTYWSQALADGIIRPAENVGAYRCQLVNSLDGKIIRIDPATGDGLPSNPFYDPSAPRAPKSRVWALGLKTPSRMTLRPGTGEHHPEYGEPGSIYLGDVGWNDWEDLNVCNRPGMNFGWPAYEGIDLQPDYYNSNVQNLDAPNPLNSVNGCNRPFFYFRELIKQDTLGTPSWPNPCNTAQQIPSTIPRFLHARPVIDWGHGSGPARVATFTGTNATTINVGASGSPVAGAQFGGACSMGGVWYTGTDFPAAYLNTYFHFDYEAQWIKSFVFDTNDAPVEIRNFASSAGGVVFVNTHPIDGGLYYITWDSTVRRVRYVANGNQPPTAVASLDHSHGPGPLTVQFAGGNSMDPEGLPLAYEWNFGDGTPVATNANPIHVFNPPTSAPTRYDVTLKVTDRSGATNSTALIVSANNTPPSVTITSPTNGTRYAMTGDTVHACAALVADNEHSSGQLAYAWQTFLHHNAHFHSEPVNTNQAATAILTPEGCDGQTYYYRIVLRVTDAAGLSATNEVRLYPDCPTNTPPPPPPPTTNTTTTTNIYGLDPARPPAGNFDLSHWYLGTPAQPQSTSISVADLLAGFTNQWFYTGTNGAMTFWCPVNGGTTSGSSYPRSELREQINPPDNTVNWTAFGTHILDAQCRVTQAPSTPKVIIGQIHSYLGDAYPLVKLVYDNGRIDAQVKESATESTDLHYYFPNVPLNSLITYRIHYQDGILRLTINGVTQTIDTFDNDPEWADQTFYFKAGSYVQDNSGTASEGGRVEFYKLVAMHTNFPPAAPVITKQPASQSVPLGSNAVPNLSVVGGLPMSYQWFKEGVLIPGATNSILSLRNVQSADAAEYHARAWNAAGSVTSAVATLTVLGGTPLISLAEALDTTNLVWTTTGSPPWEGHYGVAHDGLDQARSGIIGDEQTTSMQTTVTGPGTVSFWWKVSSQTNDDFLTFYIGSSQQAQISGSVDWQQRSFNVPSGTQTLRWSYSKGEELAGSSDRGWVDEVRFGPQPVVITAQPASRAVDSGTTVTFNVSATGAPPLTYQWFRDGTSIFNGPGVSGATQSALTLTNVQTAQAGSYSVVVSNVTGAVTSSNALLNVTYVLSLAESLDGTNLIWTTSGTPPWVGQSLVTHDGADAAHSGAIGHSQTTSFQTTVAGPGTIRFWWKASSQTNSDLLRFYVAGSERARLSGEMDWRQTNFSIASGSQVLSWSYSKNSSTVSGQDRGWVDEVSFTPQPVAITAHPASRTVDSGTTVTFNVTATGGPPLSYQWLWNGSPVMNGSGVSGANQGTLSLSNVQVAHAGSYSVIVSNSAGAVTSASASLSVTPVVSLTEALDASDLVWTTSGTPPWTGQSLDTHDGVDAARSGAIGHSVTAYFQTTVAGPGTVRFWWKVSSQTNSDLLRFYVGGSERARLSGEMDWRATNIAVPTGSQTLRWSYSKNSSTVAGQDRGWVDEILYERLPAPLAPDGLIATPVSISRIDLAWTDNATNENGYRVERATNGATAFTQIASLGSNVTAYASTGLLAGSTYQYRIRAVNAAGNSAYSGSVTSGTLPFTSAKINFQPASAAVPPGYFVDGGLAYGARGNGLVYGWNSSRTSSAVDRNSSLSPDQRYDTHVSSGTSTGTRWELAVPNGQYNVLIVAGDPGSSSGTHRLSVEGVTAIYGSVVSTNRWLSNRLNVTVTDGRLSVSNLAGASNNKICFLDITRPVSSLACQPGKTVECGTVWDFDPPAASVDSCTGGVLPVAVIDTATNANGACGFSATRIWQAVDGCGNTNTCSQTVTVVDTTPPGLVCSGGKTVECGASWSFDAPSVVASACDGTNVTLAVVRTVTSTGNHCGGSHQVTRTWSATDACGNSNICSQTVTVLDTSPPSLVCLPARTVELGSAWTFDTPAAVDACEGENLPVAILGTITNVLCGSNFVATRTWVATDGCGNSNVCSQTITVVDAALPVISCGAARKIEAGTAWDFDDPVVDGPHGATNLVLAVLSTTTNTSCGSTFVATRAWSVIDGCGNSNTCSQTITVTDVTPPALACQPARTVECGNAWDFDTPDASDLADGTNLAVAVVSTVTNGLCGGTFSVTRTWSATDGCGNSNTCSQTILIADTTPPVILCDDIITCDAAYTVMPTAGDHCDPAPQLACTRGDGQPLTAPFPIGQTTLACSAVDACGNSNTCHFTVTMLAPLAASGPADQTILPGSDVLFSTTAGGSGPFSYVWRFNGEILPGAATNFLILQNVPPDASGNCCVEITSPCGSVTNCAALSMLPPQPALCTMTQGSYADTNAQFAGTPLLTVLTNLFAAGPVTLGRPGTSSAVITVDDIGALIARLPASGPAGALPAGDALSLAALPLNAKGRLDNALAGQTMALILNSRLDPALTNLPLTGSLCTRGADGVREFNLPASVLAALVDPVLAISNTTAAGLLELAQAALAGLPTATASLPEILLVVESINAGFDGCRSLVTCGPLLAPANDDFAQRQPVPGGTVTNDVHLTIVTGRNVTAGTEPGEPEHASVPGGKSVWWQWTPAQSGTVRIRTDGSSFDTVLAVYAGLAVDQLTPVAGNDDHDGGVWSEAVFDALAGTTYQIAVDGRAADSGSIVLTIVQSLTP